MNSRESKLSRDSFYYVIGGILSSSISVLLLIPILVSVLSPEEYGIISLVAITSSGLSNILILGTHSTISQNFHKKNKFFGDNKSLLGALISFFLGFGILLFFIFICFMFIIRGYLTNFDRLFFLGLLTIGIAICESILILASTLFKVKGKPIPFLGIGLARVSILFLIILLLNHVNNLNDLTKIIADFLTLAIISFTILWIIKEDFRLNFNKQILRKALIFGVPLTPHVLANFFLTTGDIYIIEIFLNTEAVGIYSLGYQLSLAIGIITMGFDQAWTSYYYEVVNNPENDNIARSNIFHIFSSFVSFAALVFIFSLPLLFKILRIEGDFYDAMDFMPLIIVGMVFQGIYFLSCKSLINNHKTGIMSIITIFCAILNIILNIILIPIFGINGAALSTFISYLSLMIITTFFSQNYDKVDISYFKTGLPLFLLTIFALIKIHPNEQIFLHLQVLIAIILIFSSFLVIKDFKKISSDKSNVKI